MSTTQAIQIFSISTALIASGGIASYSLFCVPVLQSQPASRSLPSTRWLFSRGSHIFPQAALLAGSGFAYLSYNALPPNNSTASTLLSNLTKGKPMLYLAAALLSIAIAPTTSFMIPTNFELIKMNEELRGSRSAASAEYREKHGFATRSAEQSTNNEDDVNQFTDLSGPQERTVKDSSKEEDERTRELLEKFKWINWVRAGLLASGGIVGLMGALA